MYHIKPSKCTCGAWQDRDVGIGIAWVQIKEHDDECPYELARLEYDMIDRTEEDYDEGDR